MLLPRTTCILTLLLFALTASTSTAPHPDGAHTVVVCLPPGPRSSTNAAPPTAVLQRPEAAAVACSAAGRHTDGRVAAMAAGPWWWPLEGSPVIVRRFEPPPEPWMAGHRGVDLAAQPGDLVLAAGAGVVRFAGVVVDRPVVSISHGDGLITTYEPVTPLVKVGETVALGQPIGRVVAGHSGCDVACLHWGLREGESYLDPLSLIGRVRVRLLPLAGLPART